MKRIAFIVAFFLLVGVHSTFAAGTAATAKVQFAGLRECSGALITGSITIGVYDANGTLLNGTTPVSATVHATHSNGAVAPIPWDFVAGENYNFSFLVGSTPVVYATIVVVIDGTEVSSPLITVYCDGRVFVGQGGDSRINRNHCDLMAALYSTARGIEVWMIEADSSGTYMGAFTTEDIAPFADAPPAVNTFVRTIWPASLEVLTTGELQIKIAPDAEGKSCTVVVDGIPVRSVYFR